MDSLPQQKVVAGYDHTLAINSNKELYVWGRNNKGMELYV